MFRVISQLEAQHILNAYCSINVTKTAIFCFVYHSHNTWYPVMFIVKK